MLCNKRTRDARRNPFAYGPGQSAGQQTFSVLGGTVEVWGAGVVQLM